MSKLNKLIKEELSKIDVKDIIDKKLNSKDLEAIVVNIITKHVEKDKALENRIKEITKDVIIQFHKNIWVKRNMLTKFK